MADSKISGLAADTAPATGDLITTVDISDTSMAATGTNKQVTVADLKTAIFASPTFTGVPAAPTAVADTNTTQLATTAFVLGQAATQAQQETSTSVINFITPGRQQFHPSAAKFWAQITGAGTPAITTSFNTGSVTDVGTGEVRVTYTTAFSSANYCVLVSGVSTGSTVTLATLQWISQQLTTSTEAINCDGSATTVVEDPSVGYNFMAFGDQ